MRRTWTPTPKPHPSEPSTDGPGTPGAAPIWSVVIASIDDRESNRSPSGSRPPARSMRANDQKSSTVDTSPPPAEGNAGIVAQSPAGGSKHSIAPVSTLRASQDVSRDGSDAKNAVSRMPSGSKT